MKNAKIKRADKNKELFKEGYKKTEILKIVIKKEFKLKRNLNSRSWPKWLSDIRLNYKKKIRLKIMSQKITCPHCEKEFPMEDGLSSHLKDLEIKAREKIEKEQDEKLKKNLEQLKVLEQSKKELEISNKQKEDKIKSINEEKEKAIKEAVKNAVDTEVKNLDKENKEHYESL